MNRTIQFVTASCAILLATAGAALAEDLVFTLKNSTSEVLERFYTSPSGVEDWEEDVFGQDVLKPGQSIKITIADGRTVCNYDMRFEFSEDSDLEDMEDTQDLCETGSYEITE
ncbi:hypothetical protein ACQQ2Q_03490 [Agrobacterium sp. ES01]|uniref:hypothetical protein n=1 Tax=Agrobacterium sp. ES01 TaxID=3420714 RepID=UPI003D12E44E